MISEKEFEAHLSEKYGWSVSDCFDALHATEATSICIRDLLNTQYGEGVLAVIDHMIAVRYLGNGMARYRSNLYNGTIAERIRNTAFEVRDKAEHALESFGVMGGKFGLTTAYIEMLRSGLTKESVDNMVREGDMTPYSKYAINLIRPRRRTIEAYMNGEGLTTLNVIMFLHNSLVKEDAAVSIKNAIALSDMAANYGKELSEVKLYSQKDKNELLAALRTIDKILNNKMCVVGDSRDVVVSKGAEPTIFYREYDTIGAKHEMFTFGKRGVPNDYFPHIWLEKIMGASKSDRERAKKNADFIVSMLDRYINNKTKQQETAALWKNATTTT